MGDLLTPLLAALAAGVLFTRGFAAVRRRGAGHEAGWDRAALFAAGLLAGVLGLVLFHEAASERASAHMVQHVLVGDLAPALLLVALRGALFQAVVPAPLRRLATRLRPGPSLAAWAVLLWFWHVPAVYDRALSFEALHVGQHASFLLGGLLLWNQLVDPAGMRRLSLWGSLGYALAAMMGAQALVAVLVLSYRPLYAYGSASDQSLAGLVMTLEQFATLGAFAFFRLRAHFRAPLSLSDEHPLRA
ncbi:MAG: cytochrome c oxidase assembly protein [Gaiellaceae bacterium]